ncbi:hypothetical protein LTR92_011654 [Exophiala xenobiotica]|nr:hypothetical protein LTR92_011654 [Exophiala xenobiotica]KAK5310005.1 hypothetical protein LTR93_012130 [Exophiala xenobiotica]
MGISGHGSQVRSALAPISGNLARKTVEDDRFAKILAAVVEERKFPNANAIAMGEAEGLEKGEIEGSLITGAAVDERGVDHTTARFVGIRRDPDEGECGTTGEDGKLALLAIAQRGLV